MKHFTQVSDLTRDEYTEVFRRALIFQDKPHPDHASLATGKALAIGFFQESTRTVAGLQASIIKLGGGWLGITSSQGSYVESGEESMEDTLLSLAEYSDIMAVRHKDFDLSAFASKSPVPLINGMCGGDEHSTAALAIAYTIQRQLGKLDGLNIGIYGMTKSSRPAKGLLKALSKYNTTFYEDSVVDELQTPPDIRKIVEENGSKIIKVKLDDFLEKIDFLLIVEGLPQSGEDEAVIKSYNSQFKILGKKDLDKLRKDAIFMYGMPSVMTDGRLIVKKEELDKDKRMIGFNLLREFVFVNMALTTLLLDIEV